MIVTDKQKEKVKVTDCFLDNKIHWPTLSLLCKKSDLPLLINKQPAVHLFLIDRLFSHQLCVHVGVHGLADSILLEMCGHNHGYNRPDESGKKCAQGCCVDGE